MYISKLKIKNYRTFKDFSITLKPLTLIIGENNIGKSNLLDSIGLIFSQDVSFFKRRILEVADFNYDVIVKLKRQILDTSVDADQIQFPEITIEATLTDWNEDQEAVVADWYSNPGFTEAKLTYIFAPNPRFNTAEEINQQRSFISRYIEEHGADTFDGLSETAKLELINFPVTKYFYTIYGGAASGNQVNNYFLNQIKFELLDALRDACSELVASHNNKLLFRILNSKEQNEYQDLKGQLVGLQRAIKENKTLQDIRKGISEQLDKISLVTDDTSNVVDLLFTLPDVSDLLKKISLIYGENPIKIERNGTGRNNLLFISLVLSYIEDVTHSHSTYFRVVGIEEPESHLHPNLQDHLAHNIEQLIRLPATNEIRKDIQLLITSHSTHITTKIDFENTVVMYHDGDKISSHYILSGFSKNALGTRQIKYLNKYLDAVNTNLFYSRKVILVEGISEKLLIPVFFKLNSGYSAERSSCCVISVNGLAFSYFLEIIRNGFFQKCLVLTDRDTDVKSSDRAENLQEMYKDVTQVKIAITKTATFEKDLIECNSTGAGRSILLEIIKQLRPISGKEYVITLNTSPIETNSYFSLVEEFKSEFAYALMLRLDEDSTGFNIPEYILDGFLFLT